MTNRISTNSKFSDLRMSTIKEINKQIKQKEVQLKKRHAEIKELEEDLGNN